MKKIILFIVILALVSPSFAGEFPTKKRTYSLLKKDDGGEKCFDENTHIINIGIGFGSRSYHSIYKGSGYNYGRTPAFSLTYEQPWKQKLGPGYLGIGAYLGFQHEYYDYDNYYLFNNSTYYYHHNWNYYMVAARGVYHWDVLNTKNAEVYAGVIIGMRFQTHSYQTNDPGNNDPYSYRSSFAYPAYSVFAGARWYFAKHFGFFGEAGYGISYVTGGFSIKF